jgi:hypothetical protein
VTSVSEIDELLSDLISVLSEILPPIGRRHHSVGIALLQ